MFVDRLLILRLIGVVTLLALQLVGPFIVKRVQLFSNTVARRQPRVTH